MLSRNKSVDREKGVLVDKWTDPDGGSQSAKCGAVASASYYDCSRGVSVGVDDNYCGGCWLGAGALRGDGFESPFEEAVARIIREAGFHVHPQVGVKGFRIDLGVK